MSQAVTAIVGADALFEFVRCEHTRWLGDGSFAVHPFRLNRVQPGALARQAADNETYTLACALHLAVVSAKPVPHVLARVPRGVVPHQEQGGHALTCQSLATPGQEVGCDLTERAAGHKAEQHLVGVLRWPTHQNAVTGQGLGICIVFAALQLLELKLGIVICPAVLLGLCESAPPDLVGKAERPGGVGCRQLNQAVASLFFAA